MMTCLLTQDLLSPPEFRWTLALNNAVTMTITYLSFEDLYDYGLSVYKEYNTLTLNGTLTLRLSNDSILNVTCVVSNTYGNDRESTSISLCGKYY